MEHFEPRTNRMTYPPDTWTCLSFVCMASEARKVPDTFKHPERKSRIHNRAIVVEGKRPFLDVKVRGEECTEKIPTWIGIFTSNPIMTPQLKTCIISCLQQHAENIFDETFLTDELKHLEEVFTQKPNTLCLLYIKGVNPHNGLVDELGSRQLSRPSALCEAFSLRLRENFR